jgi:hypothetical protein
LPDESAVDVVGVEVGWPAGMALAGPDAGNGWRCVALDAGGGERAGAACQRPAWPAGESRTARLPVTVAETLGGLAPITVDVTAGERASEAGFRVPVAPAGLGIGYAGAGPLELAMVGNTWLSCPIRPVCLDDDRLDNNFLALRPYLPGPGEPAVPPGLTDPLVAASGAHLPVPAGVEVAWAALHWATTAGDGPRQVRVRGPGGGWQAVTADTVQRSPGRPLWQASANVTELVRGAGGGPWWVAATTGPLPTSGTLTAGWSLTVMYEGGTAAREVAVFTGPVPLSEQRSLSVTAGTTDEQVEVGLVGWEGDRTLTGDQLLLAGQPLGEPENALASRAAGALECGGEPAASCGWHTFGIDVGQYRGTGSGGGAVSLRSARDPLDIGVLVLAVETSR